MGQALTAGTISAIIVILIATVLIIVYVYTFPPKKNGGFNLERGALNNTIKDGSSARILCLGTGRYLRRRPNFTNSECSDLPYPDGHTLVTADATRSQATVWSMRLCRLCPSTTISNQGTISVDGQWCFYDPEGDNAGHCLTFTQYLFNAREFNGSRTILKSFPFGGGPYTKGLVDELGNLLVPAQNFLSSNFWFDLEIPEGYRGPNGAFRLVSNVNRFFAFLPPVKEYLSDFWSNGIYYNPAYDGSYPPPVSPPPGNGWEEQTCYELKGTSPVGLVDPTVSNTFFIEVV